MAAGNVASMCAFVPKVMQPQSTYPSGVVVFLVKVREKDYRLKTAEGLDYQQMILNSGQGRFSSLGPCSLCPRPLQVYSEQGRPYFKDWA